MCEGLISGCAAFNANDMKIVVMNAIACSGKYAELVSGWAVGFID
jgi:hypothetical protein